MAGGKRCISIISQRQRRNEQTCRLPGSTCIVGITSMDPKMASVAGPPARSPERRSDSSRFDFWPRTRLVFADGASRQLGELARELGFSRTLLVADRGIVGTGHIDH